MSLYQCPECNQYYQLSNKLHSDISKGCKEKGWYQGVVVCKCGRKTVAGGEEHEKNEIYMYGHEYNYMQHGHEKLYDAVMLVECKEGEETASTYEGRSILNTGRTVYLKPALPEIEVVNVIYISNGVVNDLKSWIVTPENKEQTMKHVNDAFFSVIEDIDGVKITSIELMENYLDDGYKVLSDGGSVCITWSQFN
jgi:hypothetical protein